MINTLYVYEHCPYCIKARMIFGLKNVPLEVKYIQNDDVDTPTKLIGKKMVPILVKADTTTMGESLDIVHYIDNELGHAPLLDSTLMNPELPLWLEQAKNTIYSLAMPRWSAAEPPLPEFETVGGLTYFTQKKEAYLGKSFERTMAESLTYITDMNERLALLEPLIHSAESVNEQLSLDDLHLFAALHSLSIVSGLTYPPLVEAYRQHMATKSGVPLLSDRAL